MKTIKSTTRRGQYYIRMYNASEWFSVNDAYKNPSWRKVQADEHCQCLRALEKGEGYRIIAANTQAFTAAWRTKEGLRVETRSCSYIII